jgi:PPOX class probable F420-dependent enzyme
MAAISSELQSLLESDALGHLVTINPDGSPQVSVVWLGLESDEITIGHLGDGHKISNIKRDPRVALTIEAHEANDMGLRLYAIIHGTARVEPGGAPELLQQLAFTYIGDGVKFPPMDHPPAGSTIRVAPSRIGGVGPWAEQG